MFQYYKKYMYRNRAALNHPNFFSTSFNFKNEEWADIVGFEGLYMVSNLGRIKSLKRRVLRYGHWLPIKEKILKPRISADGYFRVALKYRDKDKSKDKRIHIAVAEAFIPNPNNKPEVNHKNSIKSDCSASNLEWVTHKENMTHAAKSGTIPNGINRITSKLNERKVRAIRRQKHISCQVLGKKYGVSHQTIRAVIQNKKWAWVK